MEEIVHVEKLKKAIILLKGALPVPRYSFEFYELENTPISYYKTELINIVHSIHDEHFERNNHCSSTDCSAWKIGPAPKCCKECPNYR